MKVDLLIEPFDPEGWSSSTRPVDVKRMLQFVVTRAGYVHRPRSSHLWPDGRISIALWCGQLVHPSRGGARLAGELPDGREVCGTCDGRAVGAGQIPSRDGVEPLIFSPHRHLPRCDWERGHRNYGWTDYYRCYSRARWIAVRAGQRKYVCAEHRRSAITRGWDVASVDTKVGA